MLLLLKSMFELLPVALAVLVIASCALRFQAVPEGRLTMGLAMLAATLLIVAQTSWWTSSVLSGDFKGTWFANAIWTIFNTLVMLVFLLMSRRRKT